MCGYFCIITSENMKAKEAFELYKSRDASEKLFKADGIYRLDYVVTANQKTILKAFGIDANYVKRKTQQISDELNPKVLKVKIDGGKNTVTLLSKSHIENA